MAIKVISVSLCPEYIRSINNSVNMDPSTDQLWRYLQTGHDHFSAHSVQNVINSHLKFTHGFQEHGICYAYSQ